MVKAETELHDSAIAYFNNVTVVSNVAEHANIKMKLFKIVIKWRQHTASSFSTTREIIFPMTCNI